MGLMLIAWHIWTPLRVLAVFWLRPSKIWLVKDHLKALGPFFDTSPSLRLKVKDKDGWCVGSYVWNQRKVEHRQSMTSCHSASFNVLKSTFCRFFGPNCPFQDQNKLSSHLVFDSVWGLSTLRSASRLRPTNRQINSFFRISKALVLFKEGYDGDLQRRLVEPGTQSISTCAQMCPLTFNRRKCKPSFAAPMFVEIKSRLQALMSIILIQIVCIYIYYTSCTSNWYV